MLKLFWATAPQGGVPADAAWQAAADWLTSDKSSNPPLQSFTRGATTLPLIESALAARLDAWLAYRSQAAPLTIMLHGFDYKPGLAVAAGNDDPFSSIYSVPGHGIPAELSIVPLVGECDDQGGTLEDVAIAFAWLSEGTMSNYSAACWNNDYPFAALDLAPLAAKALATVLGHMAARAVPIRILAHSLGTRLATLAIGMLKAQGVTPSIERVILLGGAEFCVDAAATYAGCGFDVINMGSDKDTVLLGGEMACAPTRQNGSTEAFVIGRNGLGQNSRWIDVQLDAPTVAPWFTSGAAPTGVAYQVNALAETNVHPHASLNHWAYYTNAGNRRLVHDLVQHPSMTAAALQAAGVYDKFDVLMWGRFQGRPIPATPTTCAERRPDSPIVG